MFLGFIAH